MSAIFCYGSLIPRCILYYWWICKIWFRFAEASTINHAMMRVCIPKNTWGMDSNKWERMIDQFVFFILSMSKQKKSKPLDNLNERIKIFQLISLNTIIMSGYLVYNSYEEFYLKVLKPIWETNVTWLRMTEHNRNDKIIQCDKKNNGMWRFYN